ncbi:endonuclease 8-like 3 [Lingula anatina]|uniref:Endonuclease 8-like 3 n=1 Tax=Lingula anatina TaxID=7574 RepID=A0A1S3K157_LINAN|nr:endonuclease 8-like 3 [Lingula anatina]|eukprot:XP_013416368.1 endonuclease 8-like 3 [Lingula anatina]
MVEGPGCTIKGEKIRARLRGQKVKRIEGNATKMKAKKLPDGGSQFDQFIGLTLQDVQTLGKELFMYFGEMCLRIHFLMAGSFRVNGQQLDNDYSKVAETASLEIQMSQDVLTLYKSGVEVRLSAECRGRFEQLKSQDICSPSFNHTQATAAVAAEKDRMACDVLLDQTILPGVGNIIKNEALFDSGVKPDTKISALTEVHVSFLVKMTRDYSMVFLECRRKGTKLPCKIYNRHKCTECGNKVTITRMGENERMTYFCDSCQVNDLQKKQSRHLPSKNSLLGWVSGVASNKQQWGCPVCTLLNAYNRLTCSACGHKKSDHQNDPSKSTTESCDRPEKCNENPKLGIKRCAGKDSSLELPASKKSKVATVDRKLFVGSPVNEQEQQPSSGTQQELLQKQQEPPSQKSSIPMCTKHNKPCVIREVRKKGENQKRVFFACSLSRGKQCDFFKWADEAFPLCEHNKRCVIRTVFKQGVNNGRKFFACTASKNKQCGFFQWAEGY